MVYSPPGDANLPGLTNIMLEMVLSDPLVDHIQAIQEGQSDNFWSFKGAARRKGAHALIHYPAMMVPTLQGRLLDAIKQAHPKAKTVLDPFVGSGTILVESMSRGFDFTGLDINPLATLACLAKSGPYFLQAFSEKCDSLSSRICADNQRSYYTSFQGRAKWFSDSVSLELSKIARGIEEEPQLWARRLFWLAMAKVIRITCNSRMSTYKLHIKPADACSDRDPIALFKDVLTEFAQHLRDQHEQWTAQGLLQRGRYIGRIDIHLGDSRYLLGEQGIAKSFDVVMTSPPYGDNATTIPYGQYSYLPMQWISKEDVCSGMSSILLENTHGIDSASLGGSRREAISRGVELMRKYDSAKQFGEGMPRESSEFKRFSAFFSDLEDCLEKICDATNVAGYQTWTIGNRHLGGRRVPMEKILVEMLAERQVQTVARIRRSIHAKKMAYRNSLAPTMDSETILVARKAKADRFTGSH